MPFLIDGHNLIPKMGLSLRNINDEQELIERLQEFCRLENCQVEIYFDGAPAGQAGTRKLGRVSAHFIRLGNTADNAIRLRLHQLSASAKNWTVVTSDRSVQTEARAVHARVISSEAFARLVAEAGQKSGKSREKPEKVDDVDVQEWLEVFRQGKRS
jgi:predicted RNA-binding protein with PIN domain